MHETLVERGRRELALAGLLAPSADYDGMVGRCALELLELLAGQGHSGGSVAPTLAVFQRLAAGQPLSPLSGDADEWAETAEPGLLQNVRCTSVFRRPDGTAFNVNGRVRVSASGDLSSDAGCSVEVEFPYSPVTEFVPVDREPCA